MKRVFIVHGWGGNPSGGWIPWLKKELKARKFKVLTPKMPNTDTPEIMGWVEHLAKSVGEPDAETYFVGHSIGGQTILRYLAIADQPVGGAVFVAGWFDLENLEDAESEGIAKPWISTPIDLKKVQKVLKKSTLIISDNDPYGAFKKNKKQFATFVSRTVVLHDAGHIESPEEPAVLAEFMSVAEEK